MNSLGSRLGLTNTFTPQEIEFFAENELIEIEPLVSLPKLSFIQGDFGPFLPPRTIKVPIWLAIVFKKRSMCIFKPPIWLRERLKDETSFEEFSALPYHFTALAKLILEAAREDIPDYVQVQSLLQDLREVRRSKIRQGVEYIDLSHIRVDNLGWMEINELRPTFCRTFETLKRLQMVNVNEPLNSSHPMTISQSNYSVPSSNPNNDILF